MGRVLVNAWGRNRRALDGTQWMLTRICVCESDVNVVPCLPPCLLRDLQDTVSALQPCVNQTVRDLMHFVQRHNFSNYMQFYKNALLNTSALCRFSSTAAGCFVQAVHGLCGSKVATHLKLLHDGLLSYANCQADQLPVLQCMAHPDMMLRGYPACISSLVAEVFHKYFLVGHFNWAVFYEKAIVRNDGLGFKVLLTQGGLCLDTAVAHAQGCGAMRGHVLRQVEVVREFLDYKEPKKGTDALKCFANPKTNKAYLLCQARLIVDLIMALGAPPTVSLQTVAGYLENNQVSWFSNLLWFRTYYLGLSACTQLSTERFCQFGWSTRQVIKMLKPTDQFFASLRPAVPAPDCLSPPQNATTTAIPSGGATSSPATFVVMATAFLLLLK